MKTSMLLFCTSALILSSPVNAADSRAPTSRGEQLLSIHCGSCHAIRRDGRSAHPEAPPFRSLGKRYPIETLSEALAEGLSSGHPDMPDFVFESSDVGAILTYMKSIQQP